MPEWGPSGIQMFPPGAQKVSLAQIPREHWSLHARDSDEMTLGLGQQVEGRGGSWNIQGPGRGGEAEREGRSAARDSEGKPLEGEAPGEAGAAVSKAAERPGKVRLNAVAFGVSNEEGTAAVESRWAEAESAG